MNVFEHLADIGAELKFSRSKNSEGSFLDIHVRRIVDGVPLECLVQIDGGLIGVVGSDHDAFILTELSAHLEAMDKAAKAGVPENLKA